MSELDNENFRGFKLISTLKSVESAAKKRKFNSKTAAKNDKQERDCYCFNNSPAAWKKDIIKAKKYTITKDINLLII